MKHLLTFAQFIVRKFAKETGKGIYVTASTRMSRCIGKCIRYKYRDDLPRRFKGKIVYEIRLNLESLATYGEQAEDIILHELAHTKANGHGPKFKRVCAHMGIDKRHWGPKAKRRVQS